MDWPGTALVVGRPGMRRAALIWIPGSHGYRRLRLRTGPLMVVTSLGQIDGRGDVVGDERPVRGSRYTGPSRAVVWLARGTRYTQARYLPKPIGYRWTNASFIRRVRNRTLVVGRSDNVDNIRCRSLPRLPESLRRRYGPCGRRQRSSCLRHRIL